MKKIPEINRARGYFLYTADGKRYLDMVLDRGRLIMGHRQKGYGQAMKNVIDKGILPGFPSPYAHRLKQAVRRLVGSECFVYLFKSEEKAWEVLGSITPDPMNDPIKGSPVFGDELLELSELPVVISLPVPFAFAPGVVVSKTELKLADEPVSPVILAGAVRAVYNLIAFQKEVNYSDWEKAGLIEACGDKWRIEMPYIYPLCGPGRYKAVWDTFFEAGIILSYDYDKPSVLPPYGELSDGSRKKLLKLLSEC
ncbi:MAG: hypothetical protein IKO95_01155 [Spirochaetia bacterium]|nr:hypothetical protein [Spirochaetia bacterium]